MVRRVDITDCHNYYNDDATLLDIISKDLIKINRVIYIKNNYIYSKI